MSVSENIPAPPSEEESRWYYFGLPSEPRLIARTGTDTWNAQFDGIHRRAKEISNIGTHSITTSSGEDLRTLLIEALEGLEWSSVDFIRIVLELMRAQTIHDSTQPQRSPVILWVGVEPCSATLDRACHRALKCKQIHDFHILQIL